MPIRPHARGGIGQVWVARDCELQREVALKVIQPRYADREDQRARFLIEAEITGNLEHPGIVPVYSLGRNAEGRPYYAMRFIRGESLSAAIRDFHRRCHAGIRDGRRTQAGRCGGSSSGSCSAGSSTSATRSITRTAAACCTGTSSRRTSCSADIGETLVVDWGLAKVIGKADIVPPRPERASSNRASRRAPDELTPSGGHAAGHDDRDAGLHEPRAGPRRDR